MALGGKMVSVRPKEVYEYAIKPSITDLIPGSTFSGAMKHFVISTDISTSGARIIDITKSFNITRPRSASCDMVYKQLASATSRRFTIRELEAGVKLCQRELYNGCLQDYNLNPQLFGVKMIQEWFKEAIFVDTVTPAYFGKVNRTADPTSEYNVTNYDGIFTNAKKYSLENKIKPAQTLSLPQGALTPLQCFNIVKGFYDAQTVYMRAMPKEMLYMEFDRPIVDGYVEYMQSIGQSYKIDLVLNGIPTEQIRYNNIKIEANPTFELVLADMEAKGHVAPGTHVGILTYIGNNQFGYDATYGEDNGTGLEGNAGKAALQVWYEPKTRIWYHQSFTTGGTQIANPEHFIYGISAFGAGGANENNF